MVFGQGWIRSGRGGSKARRVDRLGPLVQGTDWNSLHTLSGLQAKKFENEGRTMRFSG